MNLSNHWPEIRWEWSDGWIGQEARRVVEYSKYLLQKEAMQSRIHSLEMQIIQLTKELKEEKAK